MNIKPFDKFLESNDEFRLMKDLEDLGANERTWTKEQIHSVLDSLKWADLFSGEIINENEFDFRYNEYRNEVIASFTGSYKGEFDTSEAWDKIKESLLVLKVDKDAGIEEDEILYYLDEVESAFDKTDFNALAERFIENADFYNSVEIDIEGRDRGEGVLSVSATAKFDDDNIEIDEDEIVDEILGNL